MRWLDGCSRWDWSYQVSTLQVLAPNIGELASDLGSASHYHDCLFPGVKSLLSVLSVPLLGIFDS